MNVLIGERQLRKMIATATARFILAGRIVNIRPYFSVETASLGNDDDLSQVKPCDSRIRVTA